MRAVLSAADTSEAMANVLKGVTFDDERLRKATTSELFATAYALELVEKGMPFREAYRNAAEHIRSISDPDSEDVLNTYKVPGFPGLSQPDAVLDDLEKVMERLR
jgi:argininosuccinate lyase